MGCLRTTVLFEGALLRFHVCFRGCAFWSSPDTPRLKRMPRFKQTRHVARGNSNMVSPASCRSDCEPPECMVVNTYSNIQRHMIEIHGQYSAYIEEQCWHCLRLSCNMRKAPTFEISINTYTYIYIHVCIAVWPNYLPTLWSHST